MPALLPGVDGPPIDELSERHGELFVSHHFDAVQPFAGGAAVLRRAKASGLDVVLASSASSDEVHHYPARMEVGDVVDADRDWWRVTGMQRSETHRVRWRDAVVQDDDRIGDLDDYAREPFFSGGALRFVAVHAGGVAGVCDRVRDHLVETGRADDPFQTTRLAELFNLADTAAVIVRRAAVRWFEDEGEARLARVAAARIGVADAAARSIALAQEAVGLAGHFLAHPLSATLTDLAVYLRQPAPDAQRLRIGRAVCDGGLTPSL